MFLNYLGLIRCKDEKLFTKYHCVFKKSSTFAELLKSSAIEASFGEMAEWSIAAVLKTVELRGSGGSNPSLSAERSGQNQTITVQKPTSQQLVGFFVPNMSVTKDTKKPPKTQICA